MAFIFQPVSSDIVTSIGTNHEKQNRRMFSISGKLTWLRAEAIIQDEEGREKRVYDARIMDTTGQIELSLWGNKLTQ